MRLWGRTYTDGQKQTEAIVDVPVKKLAQLKNDEAMLLSRLTELTHSLDLELPVMLKKHKNELFNYGRAVFLPSDFMESVSFDRLVVEVIIDE